MAKVTIIPAREAKNRFGELLDAVQRQPVIITKKGRPVARMIAFVDPKRFEEVEDEIWAEKLRKVLKNPQYLTAKKSEEALKRMLRHAHTPSR
ncbi:MAG: Antitoxin Phd YefM, type toxin-antitoxin system [Candidatus Parcubacteria bacterium]|jgi:prevent-host-death family protein